MTKDDLIELKYLVNKEIEKRKDFNNLLKSNDFREEFKEFIVSYNERNPNNIDSIIDKVLKDFKVLETNNIYVCTRAYYEYDYYVDYTLPSDRNADCKWYVDIESKERIASDLVYGPRIIEFETNNIVLNPYDAKYDDGFVKQNGYHEVRHDFFMECYKHGEEEAKKLIFEKYPRL